MHGKPVAGRGRDLLVIAERGAPALGVGERAVVRFVRREDGEWEARIVRALDEAPDRIIGIFRAERDGGRIEPTNRKLRGEFFVSRADIGEARDGEIVVAELRAGDRLGAPTARVVERLGDSANPRAFSLIAIHTHGIPVDFPPEALVLADQACPASLEQREDLRQLPLVTIDDTDARDFDDAVWAEPDPEHPEGWHAVVAIADVAWYVRPDDALDRAAEQRGNSVYFPDRVVPMLPEALSNELCSLKPGVDRACLAVHLWFDAEGRLHRHRFLRGLMRSAARLTYQRVQDAIDGRADGEIAALVGPVLKPLYDAYHALDRARRKRGALDLDLPERRIILGEDGRVLRVAPRARLDSHKLIEELMITANVAAAETLERLQRPCMYRIHDSPDPAKLVALHEFLESIDIPGLKLAKGQVVRPRHFNEILRRVGDTAFATLVPQLILRSQAQAIYSPMNIGHFGLALPRYAHFTSPIRRYADLLVHRSLITALGLPDTPAPSAAGKDLAVLGEQVSMTERRAAAAERNASDRYMAAHLAARVGAVFDGRINGVTRAGLFVTLTETGADGLILMRSLPGDYYDHDERRHRIVGRRTRRSFTLGDEIQVRLAEADTVTGSLRFELNENAPPAHSRRRR